MNAYSQWFFADGWLYVTALGMYLGWMVGLKACWVPAIFVGLAVLTKSGGAA